MSGTASSRSDTALVCMSHLRWDFVYQRPQHLLSRCAHDRDVVYFEEPMFRECTTATLDVSRPQDGLIRLVPILPYGTNREKGEAEQRRLLEDFLEEYGIVSYDLWYYTPMAFTVARGLKPSVIVFDCMDDLSGFLGAPPELKALERELMESADVIFTGGESLYEVKRAQHPNVHCCPSSIDAHHFANAREEQQEPNDQHPIPHPRIGFYGVIDERLDLDLLRDSAALRPNWHYVIIGPVVKIDADSLPRSQNIHYLGKRSYEELPSYLSGWDVAILPFARNAATRFISPTKTPEYLAAGRPVVSTSIRDVVRPYGERGVVSIADAPDEFVNAISFELQRRNDVGWQKQVDEMLSVTSWDSTWLYMSTAIEKARESKGGEDSSSNLAREGMTISNPA